MSKRICTIAESPCSKCGKEKECDKKRAKSPVLDEIKWAIWSNADYDYTDCSIFKVL